MIAAAILVHAFARPAESPARVQAEIDAAVNRAVAGQIYKIQTIVNQKKVDRLRSPRR